MTASAPSTMRRDIASAYLAAATKIGSWVVVSAIVYRWYGAPAFAMVSVVRATLSILNYTSLGLAPAMMKFVASAAESASSRLLIESSGRTLDYASPGIDQSDPIHTVFHNGMIAGACAFALALVLAVGYAVGFSHFVHTPASAPSDLITFTITFALGVAVRLFSDVPGAVLQTRHRIALDNRLVAATDVCWVLASVAIRDGVSWIGFAYVFTAVGLFVARLLCAGWVVGLSRRKSPLSMPVIRALLLFGGGVTIAQLADYLYAPIDFVLINRLLDPILAAVYSPAVQIDSGLLLLVGGVASVLLPKTALAHASGNVALIRKYYLRGTVVTGGLLAIAGVFVWLLSPWVFRLWLHDPMIATQVILPLVLVHTVVGGSSAVGRSVLLGMGKVKPFTIAVLSAGVANVIVSYCFVRFAGLGLKGIILGTIVVVVARCAIWQPWYVLRTLKAAGASPKSVREKSAGLRRRNFRPQSGSDDEATSEHGR